MSLVKHIVTVKGIGPGLLMHKFPQKEVPDLKKMPEDEQAEMAAYRDEKGHLYLPTEWFRQSMIRAAVHTKWKGRQSYQAVIAACAFVEGTEHPERIYLGVDEYVIKADVVQNNYIKGRIWVYRPHIQTWRVSFLLEYNNDLITEKNIRKILDDAGNLLGVGAYRPQNKGPFGRFMVVGWEDYSVADAAM